MHLLRNYLEYCRRSLTELHYFIEVTSWSVIHSLSISALSLGLISSLTVAYWWNYTTAQLENSLNSELAESLQYYPADLRIDWSGENLDIEPNTPILIPNPWPEYVEDSVLPPYLLILTDDTRNGSEVSQSLQSETLFLSTQQHIWTHDTQDSWSSIPLTELPGFDQPFTITAENYPPFVSQWQTVLSESIEVLKILSLGLIPLIYVLGKLITLTFDAVLIFVLLKLFPRAPSFKVVWQLSLQLGVISSLIGSTARLLYPQFEYNFFQLSYWILLTLVLIGKQTQHWVWPSQTPKK